MNRRLPVVSAKETLRALERAGFAVTRISGSHCRLVHQTDPSRKVTIPLHVGDLKRGTLRAIIGQSGLTVAEFLDLL